MSKRTKSLRRFVSEKSDNTNNTSIQKREFQFKETKQSVDESKKIIENKRQYLLNTSLSLQDRLRIKEMSDADVNKEYALRTQSKQTSISKSNKSNKQIEENHKRFEKEAQRQKEVKEALQAGEIIDNSPIAYIPFLYSFAKFGQANYLKKLGESELANNINNQALISGVLDTVTTPFFGFGTGRSLMGAYVGSEVGKYISPEHPILGSLIGAAVGGGIPDVASNIVQNAKSTINQMRLTNAVNQSIKNTKIIHQPFFHVSKNGQWSGQPNIWAEDNWGFHITNNPEIGNKIYLGYKNQGYNPTIMSGYTTETPYIIKYRNDPGSFSSWGDSQYKYIYDDIDYSLGLPKQEMEALRWSNEAPVIKYNNNFEVNPSKEEISSAILDPNLVMFNKEISFEPEIPTLVYDNTKLIDYPEYRKYVKNLEKDSSGIITGQVGKQQIIIDKDGTLVLDRIGFNEKTGDFETIIDRYSKQDAINKLKQMHEDYVNTLSDLEKPLYLHDQAIIPLNKQSIETGLMYSPEEYLEAAKKHSSNIIDLYKTSPEYKERFIKLKRKEYENKDIPIELSEKELQNNLESDWNIYMQSLNNINNDYEIFMYPIFDESKKTMPQGLSAQDYALIGLRPRKFGETYNVNETFEHELGHQFWEGLIESKDINLREIGDPKLELNYKSKQLSDEGMDYVLNPNEIHSRAIPLINEQLRTGKSAKQIIEENRDYIESSGLGFFNDSYIERLINNLIAYESINNDNIFSA